MAKKIKHSNLLIPTNNLLYGIDNDDNEPIILLINHQFVIEEINLTEAHTLFHKTKKDLINHSFLELLEEQHVDSEPLIRLMNEQSNIIKTLKITADQKNYSVTLICIPHSERAVITMNPINDNYQAFKTYINAIINNLPGAVYWKDKEGHYIGCNKFVAKMAGFESPEHMIGKTDYDLCWHAFAEEWRLLDIKVMEEDSTIVREEKAQLADGKIITELTFKTPLKNENGEIIGIIGTSLDITERKEMEIALYQSQIAAEAANQAKTEFIANMSHDIRTPLTGVIGMSKIIADKTNDLEEKQYAHWVNESGVQLLSLLNGILDVISADNVNDSDIREESFDIRRCFNSIAELELPSIKLKKLDLIVDIPDSIPRYIKSDQNKLHRVLLNLIGNSIKFTEKGYISIGVKLLKQVDNEALLQFSVSDTGIGIPDKLQSQVFDRFFRVNPSYKGVYKGHGIGLHIAQSYVESLGGKIKLSSQINKGTTFTFELLLKVGSPEDINDPHATLAADPISPVDENESLMTIDASTPSTQNQNAPYLLLVEDNLIAMRMIQIAASNAGCRYESAIDANIALHLIQTTTFDLIITDVGLPCISGIELTRSIREWEHHKHQNPIPIVGLTAHTGEAELSQCLNAGMNKVHTKPATFKLIKNLVAEFVKDTATISSSPKVLKSSLPPTLQKETLLDLSSFPILDVEKGLNILGGKELLTDMIRLMLDEGIEDDQIGIERAYQQKDWNNIKALAHKMKGGAAYCGLIKMQMACQYIEYYQMIEDAIFLTELYEQLIDVIEQTKRYLSDWLRAPG